MDKGNPQGFHTLPVDDCGTLRKPGGQHARARERVRTREIVNPYYYYYDP